MLPFYEKQTETNRVFTMDNLQFPLHLHPEVEILYVQTGSLIITIEQRDYTVEAGHAAIVFPHCIHGYNSNQRNEVKISIIDYQLFNDFAWIFTHYLPENPILTITDLTLKKLLEHALAPNKQPDFRDDFLIRATWYQIFALCLSQLSLIRRPEELDFTLTQQVVVYLSKHYLEKITLTQIANDLNCSPYTISNIFTKKLGIPFPDYLAQLRLETAKRLLETSSLSILEIAYEAGFEQPRSFNRSFMKFEKITPREYRQRYLK